MRYQGTAVHIYDLPRPSGPDTRYNRRLALLVSAILMLGLAGSVALVVFGLISQRL